jgi:hypothetical protein
MKTNVKIAVGLVVVAFVFLAIWHFFPLYPCPPLSCR